MKKLIPLAVVFIAAAGCYAYWDPYYPYYGYDSGEVIYYEGSVISAGADPTPMSTVALASVTPESMAQNALANFKASLTDKGCVKSEKLSGGAYEVELNGCKSKYGLLSVTGKAAFTFSEASGGGTQADIVSSGLVVNKYVVEIDSRVIRTASGGTTTLSVTSKGRGFGPNAQIIRREGTYTATLTAADECRTLDGSWKASAGGKSWNVTVSGHKRCSHLCPANGGQMTMADSDGDTGHKITVTYDGSGTAKWEWPGQKTGTITQNCGENATGAAEPALCNCACASGTTVGLMFDSSDCDAACKTAGSSMKNCDPGL